jgi:hypothetical protein
MLEMERVRGQRMMERHRCGCALVTSPPSTHTRSDRMHSPHNGRRCIRAEIVRIHESMASGLDAEKVRPPMPSLPPPAAFGRATHCRVAPARRPLPTKPACG